MNHSIHSIEDLSKSREDFGNSSNLTYSLKKGEEEDESGVGIYGGPHMEILNRVVESICDCFTGGETTDEKVQLQIIKVSLSLLRLASLYLHERKFD